MLILVWGCTDPYAGQLTDAEKALVDSLYNRDIDSIRLHYDSLCAAQYESMFQTAVDSIMKVRISEIETLRKLR